MLIYPERVFAPCLYSDSIFGSAAGQPQFDSVRLNGPPGWFLLRAMSSLNRTESLRLCSMCGHAMKRGTVGILGVDLVKRVK
jgi:hypothetical protein